MAEMNQMNLNISLDELKKHINSAEELRNFFLKNATEDNNLIPRQLEFDGVNNILIVRFINTDFNEYFVSINRWDGNKFMMSQIIDKGEEWLDIVEKALPDQEKVK